MSDSYFGRANFSRANLEEANFWQAVLRCAALNESKAIKTIFNEADLTEATAFGTDFSEADFNNAKLIKVFFDEKTKMHKVNLTGADLSESNFDTIDIRKRTRIQYDNTTKFPVAKVVRGECPHPTCSLAT